MPLILAIEPDRRQAAQLSTVIRKRVGAELILVDTTERALDAIGNRMPDLVLVPALLSPQDDAALAAALRVIAAAAHVQMLTIPVLGTPRPAATSGGGVLSVLRRVKSRGAEPDGCDPAVFAEQIASYLESAAQERPNDMTEYAATELAADDAPAPIDVTSVETIAAGETEMAPVADTINANTINQEWLDPLPDEVIESANAGAPDESVSFALEEAVRALFADPAPVAVEPDPVFYEPAAAEPVAVDELASDEPVADELLADELIASDQLAGNEPDNLAVVAFEPPVVAAEVEVVAAEVEKDEWVAVEELIAALQVMPLAAIAVTAEDDWIAPPPAEPQRGVEPAAYLIDEPEGDYQPVAASMSSPGSPVSPGPGPSVTAATPSASSTTTPGPKSEHEWVALIESLRHDVERLRGERSEKPGRKAAPPPAPKPARPERAPKAVQDEWGFFDPQQCGFAALLAKLDEVTESEDGRVNH